MIVLIDNDIVLKLSKWDLVTELIQLLGVSMENVYRLATCQYALCHPGRPAKALKRCGDQATIDRITEFCEQTNPLPDLVQSDWLERLNAVPDIDVGEVLIFAFGIEEDSSVTYIGDKRSLVALASAEPLMEVLPVLNGRAKCLEQIIAEMVVSYGLETVVGKVRAKQSVDKAVGMVFGTSLGSRSPEEVWSGLHSYYRHLDEATNGLLSAFPDPPPAILSGQHMAL